MKTSFILYIIFNWLVVGISFTFSQEEIPWEVKQRLINSLDSADVRGVISSIREYNVIEAKEKIEQVFWNTNFGRSDQYGLLELLYKFGSNLTHQYALAYIDTLEINPFGNNTFGLSILRYQVSASEILMDLGDYSKADLVFELLQDEYPEIGLTEISVLEKLLNNSAQYYETAKAELQRAVQEAGFYRDRYYALGVLYNHNQQETIPLMKQMFVEDENPANRLKVLDSLTIKHKDEEVQTLLKQRLSQDPDFFLRYMIAMKLLYSFGSPSDYKFVADYLPSEQNEEIKEGLLINMSVYKPRQPDSSESIIDLLYDLINLIDTVFTYTWLGDQQFKNELQSILQSAKTNLLAGDSLACAIQVKSFQDNVDFVYKDSLNTDPRFVTIEGWKFLYWNAQYILDRLPEVPITEGINTYSVFATHGIWLEQNSEVISGNIGVNEIGLPPFMDSDVEMAIGISTITPAGYTIKANRIKVKQGATVNANVYYNELDNNGTITGTLNTPLELPLFITLPEFHTSTPGTENIVVPQNGEYTLTPGAYGEIQVKKNGKLIFTGGEYHINKFTAGDDNQLLFQSQSEVRIKDKFDSGQGSYIGPQDTTTLSADEIVFYVEGINGNNGNLGATPKAAKIGISNLVKANFYVPNGTLWIRQNSEVEGAFIGKDVDVGIGVSVKLNSAF